MELEIATVDADTAAEAATAAAGAAKKVFVKTYGCQMNVYDFAAHDRCAGRRRLCADRDASTTPTSSLLNTCHIREKAAEKVYSELGRLREHARRERAKAGRETDDRRRRLRRAGRGRARSSRRAPAVDLVVGPQTYHRLPDVLTQARGGAEGRRDRLSRVEDKFEHLPQPTRAEIVSAASPPSSPCRKAATSSAPSASCPIRAAPRFRARWRRSSPRPSGWPRPACARSRCSARTSMPGTARAPTAREWGLGAPAVPARRDPRPRAPALHHQPSARHGRRADRRPSRPAER